MVRIGRCALALVITLATGALAGGRQEEPRLSLEEARRFMLVLINRDRAAKGRPPVKLDPVASAAGQKHAEEMAVFHYMAHRNQEGKLPDHRYTESGGVHYV